MNIAIWGMGVSGISALRYLHKKNQNNLIVINQGEPRSWKNIETILKYVKEDRCFNQDNLEGLKVDQIILAPGISKNGEVLKPFKDQGCEIICEVELASRNTNVPIIGITGTNGKTTTTTMISQALEMAGNRVFTGGNIGTPFCDIFLDDIQYDYAVIELSSFQLELIDSLHCHVAMVLNITPSHMERYDGVEDYTNAKLNIFDNHKEGDLLLYPESLEKHQRIQNIPSKKVCIQALEDFDYEISTLVGEHNKENFFCAYEVLKFLNIDKANEIQQRLINEFKAVKYRLELCNQTDELKIYNDSKSTNFASTMAAVHSFHNQTLHLILGGKLRSSVIEIEPELFKTKFENIFVYGEAKDQLLEKLGDHFKVHSFENLDVLMKELSKMELKGSLLFSPAFPSFDLYPNYLKRGEDFELLSKKYF